MTKSKKGVQGFIKLPPELKRTKRGVFYLTESEMKALKEHCKQIGTTPSILVRSRLQDIIKD
jgi:Holliday junction resolvase